MVGIQYHRFRFDLGNRYLEILSASITHHQRHSHFKLHFRGKTIFWHFNDHIGIAGAISLIRWNIDRFFVPYSHAGYTVVKTFNDHSTTYFKFKWSPAV